MTTPRPPGPAANPERTAVMERFMYALGIASGIFAITWISTH
jgi:hypothetical protein